MKKLLLLFIIHYALVISHCYSQNSLEIGFRPSLYLSKSYVSYTPTFNLYKTPKENNLFSVGLGAFLKYNVNKYFSFAGQVDWLYKGYQKTINTPAKKDTAALQYIYRDAFEFIDFKLKFYYNFYITDDIKISPNVGIGVSWLIQEKETYKYLPTDTVRHIVKVIYGGSSFFYLYNKYNWVAEFGIMASFKLSDDLNLFVEPIYNMQLNNLVNNASEYTSVKPNCWGISLGITFIIPEAADEEDK